MSKTFKFLVWSGKKAVVFLALTVALSLAVVGTTIAYIIVKTNELNNTFTPPNVDISISGDDITNTGDTDVYVRAAVVVNWVSDSDQSILSTMPVAGTDYTVEFNTGAGWTKGSDGFWYYTSRPLEAANDGDTDNAPTLITSLTQTDAQKKDGYTLTVQVISSAIQATPAEAVIGAWTSVSGVNGDGSLNITTTP